MDLTDQLDHEGRDRSQVGDGMRFAGMQMSCVAAARSRLALLAMAQGVCQATPVAGLVTTEAEALRRIAQHQAGLLICTDQLEQGSGSSLVAHALGQVPDLRVLMILCERLPDVRRAVEAGSHAVLLESDFGREGSPFHQALLAAASGQRYLSPAVELLLAQPQTDATEEGLARLTRREEEVLTLIISGFTDREIAEHLCLSPLTVRGYGKDIRRKFGARSRVELLGKALRRALGRRQHLR